MAGSKPKRARRLRLLALVGVLAAGAVVLVVVLAGGDSDDDRRAEVRETLEAYAVANRRKDYQALCDRLYARELVDTIGSVGLPCEVAQRTGLEDVRRPTLVVNSVEVSDDQALAEVSTDAANQEPVDATIRLVRENDQWRIASLAAAQPQPPENLAP